MDDKLTFTQSDIQVLAHKILDMNPDPVPRYFLLRDLIHLPPDNSDLLAARQELLRSGRVAELAEAQLPDGTLGQLPHQIIQAQASLSHQ